MKRKVGIFSFIILLILLAILSFLLYYLYSEISDSKAIPIPFIKNISINASQPSYASNSQFYPNMRFIKTDIIWNIDESCSEQKKQRIEQAFAKLEQETSILKFYNNIYPEKADIIIHCNETNEQISGKYFIAGEGGPTSIINTSSFNIIEKGKVLLLYKKASCNNYDVELHEILHVFGFDHSGNKNSIMYLTTNCEQVLTTDIIDELKRLYSIQQLPDLYFSDISATKQGAYLNFNIEIRNSGLSTAENVMLEIYSGNDKFEEFEIGNIKYGEGKSLKVEYAKLPSRSIKQIRFVIVNGKELNENNNIEELALSE